MLTERFLVRTASGCHFNCQGRAVCCILNLLWREEELAGENRLTWEVGFFKEGEKGEESKGANRI